ncbi:lactate utilization protein C [Paenibacillus sambharensis]|uniref:Lactate utilization protein C n=1 Tax=Paenibacillus sambharensis TaxID=1803190 RepID=A0A2W1LP60_9BACL|nr:lactate utilization protein C [Paenibacillus sambharensis]PZD96304.1 lactate utilization protein C [Paenibacillus sambharensis]
MADTHKEWLEQLEEQSKAKQESFMTGIAKKLGRSRVTEPPAHPFRGAPDFWRTFQWPLEERIERFTDHFKAAGGNVERLSNLEDVKAFVVKLAADMNARYIIRQQETELDSLGLEEALPEANLSVWNSDPTENWKARAAEADIGIVMADYAAAYTGSITVLSAARKGRSVSLLPTVLIAVIPLERLKTRLGEILVQFDERGREQLPAGIHFISGPSRSADIENDLTIGVHGPGIVYALLVG